MGLHWPEKKEVWRECVWCVCVVCVWCVWCVCVERGVEGVCVVCVCGKRCGGSVCGVCVWTDLGGVEVEVNRLSLIHISEPTRPP